MPTGWPGSALGTEPTTTTRMSGTAGPAATQERPEHDTASSAESPTPSALCVTCLVRVGRPRATVLHTVVCGPCWAAHGGSPDASEIGPAPTATVPSWDPRDQRHWLAALRRQDWVRDIRADGRANLLTVARLVALHAGWDTLESRPTWARLVARSKLSERTMARWLQELRVRGWLAHLEHGSTPAHRPIALAHMSGNRAAVYGLRIPLSPEEALHRAAEHLVASLADDLANHATTEATETTSDPRHACPEPASQPPAGTPHSTSPDPSHQWQPSTSGDTNGSPSWSFFPNPISWVGGFSRASKTVDNLWTNPTDWKEETHQKTALRAGSDREGGLDWAVTVPTSRFAMLVAADWLRRRLPVFASCSRKLVRYLCKPYWRAGWCNRDIIHAMDHRPGLFGQATGVLIYPQRIAAPQVFIASRLTAWRTPEGVILPGHWTSRITDAAAIKTARALVAAHHGRAGAALLRPGERALTAQRITEHGRNARPPASATTRTAAKATLAATLAHPARHIQSRPPGSKQRKNNDPPHLCWSGTLLGVESVP
jgi:hypothetical protein